MVAGAGIRVVEPSGAFYIFLDFTPHRERLAARGIYDGAALCEQLLNDTGVAILPGQEFGRPSSELTARLAYVDFDGARALAASETMPLDQPLPDDFTHQWCGGVVEATRRICEWIQS
jgi:aspartate aminotransferase